MTLSENKERSTFSKIDGIILTGVIAVSVLIRFWNITGIGLRGDEAVYAGQALVIAGDEEKERFFVLASRGTSNFLLHQFLQAIVYKIAGFSDFTTRIIPATLSVATVAVVFFIGQNLFGRWTGHIAAFLLAINGYHIALGRLALLDTTMVFLFTISIFFLSQWIKTNQPGWFYILAASAGLSILTKVPAVLLIPIVALTILSCGQVKVISYILVTQFVAQAYYDWIVRFKNASNLCPT